MAVPGASVVAGWLTPQSQMLENSRVLNAQGRVWVPVMLEKLLRGRFDTYTKVRIEQPARLKQKGVTCGFSRALSPPAALCCCAASCCCCAPS